MQLDAPSSRRAKSYRPVDERSELDRWILSELNRTCAAVVERMDAYDNFGAAQHITEFVDALRIGTSAAAAIGSGRPTSGRSKSSTPTGRCTNAS